MRVAGEKILAIPPLALDSVQGGAAPAIELFLERARLLRPDLLLDADGLSIVEGICRSLEGLPLALELAASRLELLSLSEIQSRLSKKLALLAEGPTDVAPRHRTIRAAMDWSYELLGPVDRLVFRWLSPFASGVQLGDSDPLWLERADRITAARKRWAASPPKLADALRESTPDPHSLYGSSARICQRPTRNSGRSG